MRLCSIDGCDRKHKAKGLCKTCYRKLLLANPSLSARVCSVEGCGKPHDSRGMCVDHYSKWLASLPHVKKRRAARESRWRIDNRQEHVALFRKDLDNKNGFTTQLVAGLITAQMGKCAICTVALEGITTPRAKCGGRARGMHRDHCHATGTARGILCGICNIAVGNYEKHQRPAGLRIDPYERYMNDPPARRLSAMQVAAVAP